MELFQEGISRINMKYNSKTFSVKKEPTGISRSFCIIKVTVFIFLCLLTLSSEIDAQKKWYFRAKTPFFNVNSISALDSFCIYVTASSGLYKTTDGGGSWTHILNDNELDMVRFHAKDKGIVQKFKILRATSDGGISWDTVHTGRFTAKIRFFDSLSGISGGQDFENVAYLRRTTDGGITWSWREAGFYGYLSEVAQVDSLVWVGGGYLSGGFPVPVLGTILQYSTNYGLNWIERSTSSYSPSYTDIVLMRPNYVIIAFSENFIKLSRDGGITFSDYPKPHGVYSLIAFADTLLYAGADSGRIGCSTDFGATFELQKMNTNSPVKSIEIMKNGEGYAFAADGNFYSTIQMKIAPVSVNEILGDLPAEFWLSQNYPNPFNPSTTIQFGLPQSGYVKGVVYDIIGREIATLIDGEMTAGNHSFDWDASAVLSGVYFFRIQAGNHSSVIKMVLLK